MSNALVTLGVLTTILCAACGPGPRGEGDCDGVCSALGYQECVDGVLQPPVACPEGQICAPDLGCTVCIPNDTYCDGNTIMRCNEDGTGGTPIEECTGDLVCSGGQCKTPCDAALDWPSNLGCDFWSADLDNERFNWLGGPIGGNDAAGQQYAVVIANNNDSPASVRVTRNAARVGATVDEQVVTVVEVPARGVYQINLPQAEVDGTMGQHGPYRPANNTAHTFVSPHAYHLVSTLPVVAYQFNPIIQQFSNDASTLIPIQALGDRYDILGWPTANPCGAPPGTTGHIDSIPDRTSITIVGVQDGTQVTVVPTHRVKASAGDSGIAIPQTEPGDPVTFTLNRYDVANLESWQPEVDIFQCLSMLAYDGDFTGSLVTSTKPIVVFTALERGIGFGDADPPPSPNWDPQEGDICCTDHFEEQLFPTTAFGREFAVPRSAVRSTDPGWKEPDIYRLLATENNTVVTTNLAPPQDQFTLQRGQYKDFWAQTGFALSSSQPVQLGQVLVPQHFIPDGFIGDPSLTTVPAAEQFRKEYVFLVPTTFQSNYMAIATPVNAAITYDGMPLGDGEFDGCYLGPIGMVAGTEYEQITCPLSEGKHTLVSNLPMGLLVYGYYNVGSYSFVGGSDVKIINPVE